jgi:PHD/YefM family antitoxin component YafN of YafNO toxin-antitoxin module
MLTIVPGKSQTSDDPEMRVSSSEFIRNYGSLSDRALIEPVTITQGGRDRLVLVSAEEFERVKLYGRRSLAIGELAESEVAEIAKAQVPAEYDELNQLLD